jgi:hypothetical protein
MCIKLVPAGRNQLYTHLYVIAVVQPVAAQLLSHKNTKRRRR